MSPPKVTIAIPTFNRIDYLKLAIQSALSQSYPNLEVIVSDNCSTDETSEYVSSLKDDRLIFLCQSRNIGMIGNWNTCLEKASGEFFLLLSDDDILDEHAIQRLVSAILDSADPETIAFSYCRGMVIDHNGNLLSVDPSAPIQEDARDLALHFFLKEREIRPCATLLRTEDIREVGGYTQGSVVFAVDAIVWSRILQKRRRVAFVNDPLAKYRVHIQNLTSIGKIQDWQSDLRSLAKLWHDDFKNTPLKMQRQLRNATRGHEAWMIGVIINQSAQSYFKRVALTKKYFEFRSSFVGIPGIKNLISGLLKLLIPELVKSPIRNFLIWKQQRAAT